MESFTMLIVKSALDEAKKFFLKMDFFIREHLVESLKI